MGSPEFRPLLAFAQSELARTSACLLKGLIAGLSEALRQAAANDPGRGLAERLLAELQAELEPTLTRTSSAASSVAVFDEGWGLDAVVSEPEAAFAPADATGRFAELRDQVLKSDSIRQEAGELGLPSADRPEFWSELRLMLLRLPDSLASEWADRADQAAGADNLDSSPGGCEAIPGDRDELVYPGLKYPRTRGLRLSSSAPLDPKLKPVPPEFGSIARIVSACLSLSERDRSLKHAYYPVFPFGLAPDLAPYCEKLIEACNKAAEPGDDPAKRFLARVDLDEAIHSLVFDPPAHRRSWWGQLQQRARQTLDDAKRLALSQGASVHWQTLSGRYSEAIEYTDNDRDWKVDKGGTPGWVSACLRVFARVNHKAYRGRTLYRPFS